MRNLYKMPPDEQSL